MPPLYSQAEDLLARILVAQGWTILARNFRAVGLEIDIIAHKHQCLLGVEVKYRKGYDGNLSQLENLCPLAKRQRIKKGIILYQSRTLVEAGELRGDLAIVTRHNSKVRIFYHADITRDLSIIRSPMK